MKDYDVFARVPANVMRPWLEKEREACYKYLAESTEAVALHRTQGKVQFIERMLRALGGQQDSH